MSIQKPKIKIYTTVYLSFYLGVKTWSLTFRDRQSVEKYILFYFNLPKMYALIFHYQLHVFYADLNY